MVKRSMKLIPEKPEWSNLVLILGTTSLLVVGLFLLAVPGYAHLKTRARLAAVRSNAATVQLAAESFAAANLGEYPVDPLDLLPYLPGEKPPVNPLTGKAVLFKGGEGDLSYRSPTNGGDYVIQAFGRRTGDRIPILVTLKGRREKS